MPYHHIKAPSQRELSPKVTEGVTQNIPASALFHQFQLFKALRLTPSVTANAAPPPSRREAFPRAGNFPSLSKGSLPEGAVTEGD